jgi:hypothetical protein
VLIHPNPKLELVDPEFLTEVPTHEGPVMLPDVRKLDILNRRVIVSRKRTRNLFDLTSRWKKIVLERLDKEVLENPTGKVTSSAQDRGKPTGVIPLAESRHRRDAPAPGDMEFVDPGLFLVRERNFIENLDE